MERACDLAVKESGGEVEAGGDGGGLHHSGDEGEGGGDEDGGKVGEKLQSVVLEPSNDGATDVLDLSGVFQGEWGGE